MNPLPTFINLEGKRIRLETVARYQAGDYIAGRDKDGKYRWVGGTEITFKDGCTRVFKLLPEELDKLLEG